MRYILQIVLRNQRHIILSVKLRCRHNTRRNVANNNSTVRVQLQHPLDWLRLNERRTTWAWTRGDNVAAGRPPIRRPLSGIYNLSAERVKNTSFKRSTERRRQMAHDCAVRSCLDDIECAFHSTHALVFRVRDMANMFAFVSWFIN